MQMQLSNQMGQQNFQQQFQMPVVGHVGSQLGPFPGQGGPGPYNSLSGLGPIPGSQLPPGVSPGQGPFPPQQQLQQQNKGKQTSELIRGFPDNTTTNSPSSSSAALALDINTQGGNCFALELFVVKFVSQYIYVFVISFHSI